jgi:hypothetical protein
MRSLVVDRRAEGLSATVNNGFKSHSNYQRESVRATRKPDLKVYCAKLTSPQQHSYSSKRATQCGS